jgi:hypothetical protein
VEVEVEAEVEAEVEVEAGAGAAAAGAKVGAKVGAAAAAAAAVAGAPMMLRMANMLAGVRFSPSGLPSRTFLERMALAADVTALAVPAMKLIHEKLSSLSDARLTPAMMGTSER